MEQSQSPESLPSEVVADSELLEQLRKVGSDLGFRMRARKLFKILIAFIVFDLIVSTIAVLALVQVRRVQISVCERDNTFRQNYVDQWTPIIADNPPPEAPPDDAPAEAKAAYKRTIRSRNVFIDGLTTDFAQHPC